MKVIHKSEDQVDIIIEERSFGAEYFNFRDTVDQLREQCPHKVLKVSVRVCGYQVGPMYDFSRCALKTRVSCVVEKDPYPMTVSKTGVSVTNPEPICVEIVYEASLTARDSRAVCFMIESRLWTLMSHGFMVRGEESILVLAHIDLRSPE